jgi:hypothetical protein
VSFPASGAAKLGGRFQWSPKKGSWWLFARRSRTACPFRRRAESQNRWHKTPSRYLFQSESRTHSCWTALLLSRCIRNLRSSLNDSSACLRPAAPKVLRCSVPFQADDSLEDEACACPIFLGSITSTTRVTFTAIGRSSQGGTSSARISGLEEEEVLVSAAQSEVRILLNFTERWSS